MITIHPSRLAEWVACEARAVERHVFHGDTSLARPREEHVSAWIGQAVHARLAGAASPPAPRLMVFDKTTPTMRHAEAQAATLYRAMRAWLDASGWEIVAHEVRIGPVVPPGWPSGIELDGTLDLLGYTDAGAAFIGDFKTSRETYPAWLQLGTYAVAYSVADLSDITAAPAPSSLRTLAVVHCPRPKDVLDEPRVEVHPRPMRPIVRMAHKVLKRVLANIQDPESAVPSPGAQCAWCQHATCMVRARGYDPR